MAWATNRWSHQGSCWERQEELAPGPYCVHQRSHWNFTRIRPGICTESRSRGECVNVKIKVVKKNSFTLDCRCISFVECWNKTFSLGRRSDQSISKKRGITLRDMFVWISGRCRDNPKSCSIEWPSYLYQGDFLNSNRRKQIHTEKCCQSLQSCICNVLWMLSHCSVVFLQALAEVVKEHLRSNTACTKQFPLRCPLCVNNTCGQTKEFFLRSQGVLDHLKDREELLTAKQG